jgi:hypothetical protein
LYRLEDESEYAQEMGNDYLKNSKGKARDKKGKTTYYKTFWRTFKMSDHLPMWVEIRIDHTDQYLKYRLTPKQEPEDQAATAPAVKAGTKTRKKKSNK